MITDRPAAQRILQGARQMLQQLRSTTPATSDSSTAPDLTDPEAAGQSLDDPEVADEDEITWSTSEEDEQPPATAATSPISNAMTNGSGPVPDLQISGQVRGSSSMFEFSEAWQSQAAKRGLVGALVALAYPDRIAQRKDGGGTSGGRATFVMSTGGHGARWLVGCRGGVGGRWGRTCGMRGGGWGLQMCVPPLRGSKQLTCTATLVEFRWQHTIGHLYICQSPSPLPPYPP